LTTRAFELDDSGVYLVTWKSIIYWLRSVKLWRLESHQVW